VSVEMFARHMELADLPPPASMTRSGGEQPSSNFMLWYLAYAELYFTPVLWPDFGVDDLEAALADFAARQRRFGAA